MFHRRLFPVFLLSTVLTVLAAEPPEDPHLWLEEIDSGKALAWVEEHNTATARRLTAHPLYAELYREALEVLNSPSRIPAVEPHGKHLYNFWQDAAHPRGLYRRTTAQEFRKSNPAWETVLDLDALAQREGKPWTFGGATWQRPEALRCLISLSLAGGDSVEIREFDPRTLGFVGEGFFVPNAKSNVDWRDPDALYVATDFGPGSLTTSGYPRMVKLWNRGTPLSSAATLHTGDVNSVSVSAERLGSGVDALHIVREGLDFWRSRFVQIAGAKSADLVVPPTAAVVDAFRGQLVIWLKEDWTFGGKSFASGSIVLADPMALSGGRGVVELVLANTSTRVVEDVDVVTDGILVTVLDNVRGRLLRLTRGAKGTWTHAPIAFPDHGTIKVLSTSEGSGEAWVQFESFTTPPSLLHVAAGSTTPTPIKSQTPAFNGSRFTTEQLWATSADGTPVPYFVVAAKGLRRDGKNPVWMFGYGGFENALTPSYSGSYENLRGAYGKLWLERGGVFVLANIRGGGEFGPAWHKSVLKENHYKCFEDFESVAADLAARKITSPSHLGIEGRSNGGLLVAATMLRRPELYGAVICGNPLADMRRYHRLLAGASWMAEYGNPEEPTDWTYIGKYSPYHNVRAGLKLPPILFYTSTRDDRVHPAHARKMMARMEDLGYTVDYYENTEGGHRGSVTNEQLATRLARTFTFLWAKLAPR